MSISVRAITATNKEKAPEWLNVTAAYVWAAKDRGLILSPPQIKVCDTPMSQGSEKETLEDITSPGSQVCAQEIYKITAALEAASAISDQLPEVSDGDLARQTHDECVSSPSRVLLDQQNPGG